MGDFHITLSVGLLHLTVWPFWWSLIEWDDDDDTTTLSVGPISIGWGDYGWPGLRIGLTVWSA